MLRDSTPPLFRGLGTTLILCAAIITFIVARAEMQSDDLVRLRIAAGAPVAASELDDDGVIEEVLSNTWIECLSYLGTGLISSSFYLEWFIRRRKKSAV
jgi:hypothetical protein